jgi:hypothetical protein
MPDEKDVAPRPPASSKEEVALELMKFIASTAGVGKSATGAGFGGKTPKGLDEQVDVLLQLYERCRTAVNKDAEK